MSDKKEAADNDFELMILEAESGNDVSQLMVALHFLNKIALQENMPECIESFTAINWLIKSSRQGNIEATEKLKECLYKNIGINESNLNDVTWCIETSQFEKKSRAAASKLFNYIIPFTSNSKNYSKQEFISRIGDLSFSKIEEKLLQKAIKDNVSEEDFVNRIMRQLQGKSGYSLNKLLQNDVEWADYNSSSLFKKLIQYPGKTVTWILDNIIETAGNQGMLWLRTIMPVHQAYMLVVLFIYNLISLDALLWLLPIISFYVSLFVIVTCTMQMFYSRRKLKDVKALSDMLEKFSKIFILESAESAYTWSTLTPYISFFAALPSLIITFYLSDKTWIPCSELSFVSFIITIGCWFALSDKYDRLAALSIFLDIIAALPVLLLHMPQFPVLYQIIDLISRASYDLQLAPEFFLQLGIPSISYLIIPVIFLRIAMRHSWKGTYKILVPHLVCFLWWRVVVMFYLQSTLTGLVRASIGWAALVILLPFLILVLLIWILFHFSRILSLANIFKIFTTLLLLGSVAIYAYWAKGGFKFGNFSLENKSAKTNILLTFILLFSSIPLAYIITPEDSGQVMHYLPFHIFEEHCGKQRWEVNTMAQAMVDCSHFSQLKVNWTATVIEVTVKITENHAESFIAALPLFAANWLRCTYGTDYDSDCELLEGSLKKDICVHNKLQNRMCHLRDINKHIFEIKAEMENAFMIKIVATYQFKKAVLHLKSGDEILFRGYLGDNLGANMPIINLYNLKCLSCDEFDMTVVKTNSWNLINIIKNAVQQVWNFFFTPLFIFRKGPENILN